MGLFGGGNSSSNTTETQQTLTGYGGGPTSNTALNNVNVNGNGTLKLETTDYGAIQSGLALSQAALQSNNQALSQAFDQSAQVVSKTLSIASENQVDQSTQFQGTLVKIIGIVGAVIVGIALLKGSK